MPKGKKKTEIEEKVPEPSEVEPKIEEVAELEGVGAITAEKLREAGLDTIEMLAVSIPEQLKALDIDDARARKIIASARKQVDRFGLQWKTAVEVLKEHQARWRLSTHVPSFDAILSGGFESSTVATIHAPFGAGKSQISHWMTACMLVHDADAKVLFVDTEGTFRPERELDFLTTLGGTKEDLVRIIYSEAFNSAHQRLILEHAGKVIKENNVKLLIVDSATAHFRGEYFGRDQLPIRQQSLNGHLQVISKLTRMFRLVTLLTNQEIAVPVVGYGGGPSSKPVGGNIFGHRGFMNLAIWRPDNPTWESRIITIEKHPSLPPRRVELRLTEQGFFEAEGKKKAKSEG